MTPGKVADCLQCYLVIIVSVLSLIDECFAQNYQCFWDPRSNCRCEFNDPQQTILDFSPISKNNGDPEFDFGSYGATGDFVYAFNPCHGFSSGDCKDVAGCQRFKDQEYFDIGDPFPVSWTSPSDDTQLVVYRSSKSGQTRESWVTYTCDATAVTTPVLKFKLEDPQQQYNFELRTCLACRQAVPGCPKSSGGGGGGGVTIGGLLCILFTVAVVVYIVGGVLFMRFARGAEGKEMIPNYAFWSDFPSLIKDGFNFVISPCRRGGYESY